MILGRVHGQVRLAARPGTTSRRQLARVLIVGLLMLAGFMAGWASYEVEQSMVPYCWAAAGAVPCS